MQINSVNLNCSGDCSGRRTGLYSFKGKSEADKSSSKKKVAVMAGVAAAGALALGAYAFSKGKANSAEGTKISEVLKNGFTSTKNKVTGFINKYRKPQTAPEIKEATNTINNLRPFEIREAMSAIDNFHAPQNMDALRENFKNVVDSFI